MKNLLKDENLTQNLPLSRIAEEERKRLAQTIVRFIRGFVKPHEQVPAEIYAKAFDVALQIASGFGGGSSERAPVPYATIVEFAVELLERAQNDLNDTKDRTAHRDDRDVVFKIDLAAQQARFVFNNRRIESFTPSDLAAIMSSTAEAIDGLPDIPFSEMKQKNKFFEDHYSGKNDVEGVE